MPVLFPPRTLSAVYLLFLLGWFASAYALLTHPAVTASVSRPVWAGLVTCFAASLVTTGNYCQARGDLAGPVPESYRWAVRERDRLIRQALAAGDHNPRVPPITAVPNCFVFADIVDDPGRVPLGYVNWHYCLYYGLDSIRPGQPAVAASGPSGGVP
jgi:hypothetical protein